MRFWAIIPGDVPKKRGTFMVDGSITNPDTGETEPIRCAVHYVEVGGGHRYRIQPAGTPLPLPTAEGPVAGNIKEMPLKEWTAENNWAWAETGAVTYPSRETRQSSQLGLHLGAA